MCPRTSKMFFIAVLFFVLLPSLSFGVVKFHYRYELGKQYRYSVEVDNTMSGQGMGQDFSTKSHVSMMYSAMASAVLDTSITLNIVFEKFITTIDFPMMGLNDSTIVMKEWINKKIKVVITPYGKVVSVSAIDTIVPSKLALTMRISPVDIVRRFFVQLPPHEIMVGDSWKQTEPETIVQMGITIGVKPNIEYKLIGTVKKNEISCWDIEIGGTSSMEGSGNTRGMAVTLDGSTKTKASCYLNETSNVPYALEQTSETDMTQTVSGAQTGAMATV